MRIVAAAMAVMVGLSGTGFANELDNERAVVNAESLRYNGELPGTVVVRDDQQGNAEVLHVDEELDANSSARSYVMERDISFIPAVTLSDEQVNELDLDSSSNSYFWLGLALGWGIAAAVYTPTYYSHGSYYRYRPYYTYHNRGYRYRYYRYSYGYY